MIKAEPNAFDEGRQAARARLLAHEVADIVCEPINSIQHAAFIDELTAVLAIRPQCAKALSRTFFATGRGSRTRKTLSIATLWHAIVTSPQIERANRLVVAIRKREMAYRTDPNVGSDIERLAIRSLARFLNVFLRLKRLRRRLRRRLARK